jgi:hypothetical protein
MNKIFSFLVAILLVIIFDLFHFEAPPSASQDIKGSIVADSLVASNDDGLDLNFGFGFKPELNSPNNGDASSMTPGRVFDPVTMLLLGSGLIGLAGLGRKKI